MADFRLDLARGAVVEAAWTGLHVALWPFGFLAERTQDRPYSPPTAPRTGGPAPDPALDVPVLLVHGVIDNRSIFAVLRRSLRRQGFRQVRTMNYGLLSNDVRTVAEHLGDTVRRLCVETGHPRIRLVGHSLGGLIARYHVQRQGGDALVDTLVTLGSPHNGTHLARALPGRLARQLRPGSELLTELAGPAPGCATRMVAVYSRNDEIVLPGRNARIQHPDLNAANVAFDAVGHQALPIDPRVLAVVAAALRSSAPGRAAARSTSPDPRSRSGPAPAAPTPAR